MMQFTKRRFVSNLGFVCMLVWRLRKSTLLYMLLNAISNAMISLTLILFPKWMIDELSSGQSFTTIVMILAGAGVLLFLFKNASFWSQNRFTMEHVWFESIILSGEKFMTMDYKHTDDPAVMELNTRAEKITMNAGTGVLGTLSTISDMVSFAVTSAVSLVVLFTLSPLLIAFFVILSILSFLMDKRQNRIKFQSDNDAAPAHRRLQYLFDFMTDYSFGKDLRLFRMHRYLYEAYQENTHEILGCHAKSCRADCVVGISTYLLGALQELASYGYLVFAVLKQGVTIGGFTMYAAATHEFCGAFLGLVKSGSRLLKLCDEIGVLRDFLALGNASQGEETGLVLPAESFEIRFEHVSFQYPGQEQLALQDLTFTIPPNEKLAIVGENGAGKTTFTKLLMGLYRPTGGRILMNGVDAAQLSPREYFRLFAPVFQEVELYAMTLAENISMKPLAQTDMDRVEKCLVLADASQILEKLPSGLHTQLLKVVDPGGVELSGGERQKLAIARALYKNAPFVVLDEPTSALDPIAEQTLYQKFNELVSGRSAVFITHRLASVAFCDKVAVIHNGKLVEYGSHDELMLQKGEYYSMYSLQAKAYQGGSEQGSVTGQASVLEGGSTSASGTQGR